jgi:hypothetical protein
MDNQRKYRHLNRFIYHLGSYTETDAAELFSTLQNLQPIDLAMAYLERNPDSRSDLRALRVMAAAVDPAGTGEKPGLLSRLFSEDPAVVIRAISDIASAGLDHAAILLASLIADEHTPFNIYRNSADALARFGKKAVEPLFFVIGASSSKRIDALFHVLRAIDTDVVSLIKDALTTPDPVIRRGAAAAAGFFPGEELKAGLEALLADPLPEIAHSARLSLRQIILADGTFARFEPISNQSFKIIGTGKIGNKARSLAYLIHCLNKETDPDVSVMQVPPSVVIAVSDFDDVVKASGIDTAKEDLDEKWVAAQFKKVPLPRETIAQLEPHLRSSCPLIARSSSLLEGNLRHSFAGIYTSEYIAPASPWKERIPLLNDAVRTVQASVWKENATVYRLKRGLEVKDEKMAVLIQPLVGRWVGKRYYPLAAGIAFSHNFYPWLSEIPTDAPLIRMVYGLGSKAVSEEPACFFSPGHPILAAMSRNEEDWIFNTQNQFDFIDVTKKGQNVSGPLESALAEDLEISLAAQLLIDGHPRDIDLYRYSGSETPIITFQPLLKSGRLGQEGDALQNVTRRLNKYFQFEIAMEFALDSQTTGKSTGSDPTPFNINVLQVRPIEIWDANEKIEVPDIDETKILVSTGLALGNTYIKHIDYIVCVVPRELNKPLGERLKGTIAQINKNLEHDSYMLVGPGWWGATVPGLGIPVTYGDVSHARAFVELLERSPVNPSFGGHLFSNIVAESKPLLSVVTRSNHYLNRQWLDKQPVYERYEDVNVIRVREGLEVVVDGRSRRGVVYLT